MNVKRFLTLFLALLTALSLATVAALAEESPYPQIVIDGKKDEGYTDSKMFGSETWIAWGEDNLTQTEPVDYDRVKNTVWFTWDEEFVYLYFQAESKDDLYLPQETPPAGYKEPSYYPSWEEEWQWADCE